MQNNPNAILPYPPRADWNDPDFNACALTPTATNCVKTWGLRIYKSDYIFIYGTGLYSFFQNYDATCLITNSCQQNAMEIEQSEAVYIFGLYTIGTDNLVMMDQTRLVAQGQNAMSFGAGVILFEFP
jgi:glucan 1,3-beta-glucosidase